MAAGNCIVTPALLSIVPEHGMITPGSSGDCGLQQADDTCHWRHSLRLAARTPTGLRTGPEAAVERTAAGRLCFAHGRPELRRAMPATKMMRFNTDLSLCEVSEGASPLFARCAQSRDTESTFTAGVGIDQISREGMPA